MVYLFSMLAICFNVKEISTSFELLLIQWRLWRSGGGWTPPHALNRIKHDIFLEYGYLMVSKLWNLIITSMLYKIAWGWRTRTCGASDWVGGELGRCTWICGTSSLDWLQLTPINPTNNSFNSFFLCQLLVPPQGLGFCINRGSFSSFRMDGRDLYLL